MIFQSKMNVVEELKILKHFEKAKEFIFFNCKVNKWNSIDKIPASIIGELYKIWNEGLIVGGMKIEFDETDQFYKIIKVENYKYKVEI